MTAYARALLSTTPSRKSMRSQGASNCVAVATLTGIPRRIGAAGRSCRAGGGCAVGACPEA